MDNMISDDDSDNSSSSEEGYFYDNFTKIKAAKAASTRKRKITTIQNREKSPQIPYSEKINGNSQNTAKKGGISIPEDDDENICLSYDDLKQFEPIRSPSSQSHYSTSSSIIVESESLPSSKKPEIITICDAPPTVEAISISSPKEQQEKPKNVNEAKNMCTINIHFNGNIKTIIYDVDEPIKSLIEEFVDRTGHNATKIMLVTKHTLKRCDTNDTLRMLGISAGGSIDLDAFENLEETEIKTIRIKYQMDGRKTIHTKIMPEMTFGQIKAAFCKESNFRLDKVRFVFDSEQLDDNKTPVQMEMEHEDTIDIYLKE